MIESYKASDGKTVRRVKKSVYLWAAIACLVSGFYLISHQFTIGGFLVLTVFPFLLLYPFVRAVFGGKDSIGQAIAKEVVEAVVEGTGENAVRKAANRNRKRR